MPSRLPKALNIQNVGITLHTQAEMVHYRSKPDRVYDTDKMDETRGDGNLERS